MIKYTLPQSLGHFRSNRLEGMLTHSILSFKILDESLDWYIPAIRNNRNFSAAAGSLLVPRMFEMPGTIHDDADDQVRATTCSWTVGLLSADMYSLSVCWQCLLYWILAWAACKAAATAQEFAALAQAGTPYTWLAAEKNNEVVVEAACAQSIAAALPPSGCPIFVDIAASAPPPPTEIIVMDLG
ncbi:hypothetical protein PG995_011692 [Apiospora arundinis]